MNVDTSSCLKGLKLTEGQFNGSAVATAENDYDVAADVNYYYSEDVLFERNVNAPNGRGYSLDFDLDWSFLSDYYLQLKVRDLIGKIYWTDAPNTTAVASNDIKEYDENGYVIYNPVLSGYETYRDFTQELTPQINLQLGYRLTSNVGLLTKVYSIKPTNLYQLGGDYRINSNNRVQLLYIFEVNAISIGYNSKFFNFSITSDSFDLSQAYTFGFTITANIVFF
jgi:hypothetical protein